MVNKKKLKNYSIKKVAGPSTIRKKLSRKEDIKKR